MKRDKSIAERGDSAAQAAKKPGRPNRVVGGGRASRASGQSLDLPDATFNQELLGKQTYLTVPQLMAYAQLPTKKSAYRFLARERSIRRGHGRIFRRDVDLVLQSRVRESHA